MREIDAKISLWLRTHLPLVRSAKTYQDWDGVVAKLHKYLNDAGYTGRMIYAAGESLRDRAIATYKSISEPEPGPSVKYR